MRQPRTYFRTVTLPKRDADKLWALVHAAQRDLEGCCWPADGGATGGLEGWAPCDRHAEYGAELEAQRRRLDSGTEAYP